MPSEFWMYGLPTYGVLIGSWLLACAPFFFLDRTGWAEKYRIQRTATGHPVRAATAPEIRAKALRLVVFNWVWIAVAVVAASPALAWLFPVDAPSPSLLQAPAVGALWFVMHDLSFYTYHRTLHSVPWLYKHVHSLHHAFSAPFAWSSHAVHPAELALESVGAMLGPLAWSATAGGLSLHAWWVWLAFIQLQGVMDHCGYDLPCDPFGALPGWGGTRFHDEHHERFSGNYAAALSIIDDVMGTRLKEREKSTTDYRRYHRCRARRADCGGRGPE